MMDIGPADFSAGFFMMDINFSVPQAFQDIRLDVVVSQIHDNCSRALAAELIHDGKILVCGKLKKPGYKVRVSDQITGKLPEFVAPTVSPEEGCLDILYEDSHLLVLNKPAGRVVHPGPGNYSGTLVNALLHHDPYLSRVGNDPLRSGIVHRLDKDTSGVMVVAKTNQALIFLQKEFKQRRVDKRYLAIVSGNITPDEGEILLPIGRHPVKRKLMSTQSNAGKKARTLWKVREQLTNAALVEVQLKTGRTHQIRVHFYAIGYPIIGDSVYQYKRKRKAGNKPDRQMLHALYISFRHPFSGRRVAFESPLPDDFISILNQYR